MLSKHKNHLQSFVNYGSIYHFNEEKWVQECRIQKRARVGGEEREKEREIFFFYWNCQTDQYLNKRH